MRIGGVLALLALPAVAAGLAGGPRDGACTLTVPPGGDLAGALARIEADRAPATVCLAAGEYRLRGFVAVTRDHVHLRGAGPATVLRLEPGVESPVVVIGEYHRRVPARIVSDVSVERLRIVGGGPGGREVHPAYPYLTNSAVVVRTGRNVRLRELEVSDCRSACILTEHDCRDVVIERNAIRASTWDGIALNRTSRARLVGNVLHDNTAAGITAEHLEKSVIEDNTIRANRSHGVYLSDSYRNRFRRNRFEANTNAGVFLTCAVRFRDPGPVRCWDDSMNRANAFEGNEFAGNRRGYIVAADDAANCRKRGAPPNVSRGDRFRDGPAIEQNAAAWGECLRPVRAGAG